MAVSLLFSLAAIAITNVGLEITPDRDRPLYD